MNTVSASAAARATVLEEKGSPRQSNPLAKTGVPDTSAVMIHTESGWAMLCTLGHQTLTLSLQCIANCIYIFDSNAVVYIPATEADIQCSLIALALITSKRSAKLLGCFFRCVNKPSVTLSHPPTCELNHP